jgi:3',5'-cyclic AMP phosphodiesterase CpdA
MPFHLPPISRRRFLVSSLAAGVGALSWREAGGEDRSGDAGRWVLLADSHVAADRDRVHRGVNMAANLARVVAVAAGLEPRPAGVVLDGDVAFQKGEPGDYRRVAELLKPLARAEIPTHLTLGNHDQRENFREGLARGAAPLPLASRHVAVLETERANWFLLDSLDRTDGTPGELGTEQLGWLARALDARPGKPALVVAHHDPQWSSPPAKRTGLVDTEQLFGVLTKRKQVKVLFFGHTHQWGRTWRDGIHLINLPPVAYLFNKEAPNGWVDLRLRDGGAVLTLHALDPKHRQDGETVELAWR